eukprot:gb/GECG01003934.1/.p1 GENE.gb/GECG01003934.1/~~gb/GECG01003934.1/.p1  ORF type:complete len:106 (+),score=7.62 gb/GECG01003934.1/:1-318(+)
MNNHCISWDSFCTHVACIGLSGRKTWNDVLTAIYMVARDKWGWFDGDLQNLVQQLLSYKHGAARFTTCPDSYDDPLEYWRQVPDTVTPQRQRSSPLSCWTFAQPP